VAEPAAAAAGDHHLAGRLVQVGQQVAGRVVVDARAGRDGDVDLLPLLAMPVAALALGAGLGLDVAPAREREPGAGALVGAQVDRATPPAVATVRSALGDELLPAEGDDSPAAIP